MQVPANYLTLAKTTTLEEIELIDKILSEIENKKHGDNELHNVADNLRELRSTLENEIQTAAAIQSYEIISIVRKNAKV